MTAPVLQVPAGRPTIRASWRRGFSVVEILIVVVILGLISMIVIPLLLDSLEVGKQKRTMTDINQVGQAMMAWIQDRASAAAAGAVTLPISDYGETVDFLDLEDLLVPKYLPTVPEYDAWGGRIEYRLRSDLLGDHLAAIRSPGSDGVFSADVYEIGAFEPVAVAQDIVWADGNFVRWPQKNGG